MKKILLILALLCVSLHAQTYQFESATTASGGITTVTAREKTGWTASGTVAQDTGAVVYRIDGAGRRLAVIDADGDTLWFWPQSLHPFSVKDGTSLLSGIDSTGRGYFGGNATTTGQTNRALLNVVGISDTLLAIVGDGNRAPGDSTLLIHASGNVQSQGRAGFGAATSGQAQRAMLNVLGRAANDTLTIFSNDGGGLVGDSTIAIDAGARMGIKTFPSASYALTVTGGSAANIAATSYEVGNGGSGTLSNTSSGSSILLFGGGAFGGGMRFNAAAAGNRTDRSFWFQTGSDTLAAFGLGTANKGYYSFGNGIKPQSQNQAIFTIRPAVPVSDTLLMVRNDKNATLDSTFLVHANADLQSASRAGFGVATVGQARRAILNVIGSADTILAAIGDVNKAPGDSTAIIFADGSHQFGVTAGGTNAFSGTAEHDTVTVTGASVNDIYTVTIKGATAPAAADLFAVEALATGFAVHRSAAGTSGLEYYWRRERR